MRTVSTSCPAEASEAASPSAWEVAPPPRTNRSCVVATTTFILVEGHYCRRPRGLSRPVGRVLGPRAALE